MVSQLRTVTVDCRDAEGLGRFWSQVLEFADDPANPNQPGDQEWLLESPGGGPGLLFIQVPESKAGKNRLHLDLVPADRTRDAEVDRLLALGAELVDDRRNPDGTGWAVLADPEGNEFCLLRSEAERAATPE